MRLINYECPVLAHTYANYLLMLTVNVYFISDEYRCCADEYAN